MPDEINDSIKTAVSEAKTEVTAAESEVAAETEVKEAAPAAEVESKEEVKEAADAKAEPAKADKEEEEEFWQPTADELAAIDKNPELKKVYRSMVKGFTAKTQGISKERKDLQERVQIADWVQANPAEAARILAASTGMTIAEAKAEIKETKEIVDELEQKWAKTVGPDTATLLRPLFEETAADVAYKVLEKHIAPWREKTQELEKAAQARGISASLREFGAKVVERGEEWDQETQDEMAKLSQVVEPGQDTTIEQYLEILHDKVWAQRARQRSAKANLERLRRIKNEQEPTSTLRPQPKGEERITEEMSEKDSIALAVAQARRSLGR